MENGEFSALRLKIGTWSEGLVGKSAFPSQFSRLVDKYRETIHDNYLRMLRARYLSSQTSLALRPDSYRDPSKGDNTLHQFRALQVLENGYLECYALFSNGVEKCPMSFVLCQSSDSYRNLQRSKQNNQSLVDIHCERIRAVQPTLLTICKFTSNYRIFGQSLLTILKQSIIRSFRPMCSYVKPAPLWSKFVIS